MDERQKFLEERKAEMLKRAADTKLQRMGMDFVEEGGRHKYSYQFDWLSRPIIQYPQDMVAMQEIIWKVKPDLIIETGIAHGGSLIMSASMLMLLDCCEALAAGKSFNPAESSRRVLGVDIEIRPHNRKAIEAHPLSPLIEMVQGSSIAPDIIAKVQQAAKNYEKVLVVLDSNHTHAHVLSELEAYAPLVSVGSYCVVFDTVIEDTNNSFPGRDWGKGNNPKTAVRGYLKRITSSGAGLAFEVDKEIDYKLLITLAPDGYLKRTA
jgi:cephalosporin hydroxylase